MEAVGFRAPSASNWRGIAVCVYVCYYADLLGSRLQLALRDRALLPELGEVLLLRRG